MASPTPETPPTDRPLTAGDVPLLRDGDLVAPVSDLTDYRGGKLLAGVPVQVLNVSSDGYIRVTDPERGHLSYAFTFVSRPATSAASEGEGARAIAKRLLSTNFDLLHPEMEPSEQLEFEDSITNAILAALASPPVSERERELEGALREIEAMCPATCETSLAHDMAQIASEALTAQPAGEGK